MSSKIITDGRFFIPLKSIEEALEMADILKI